MRDRLAIVLLMLFAASMLAWQWVWLLWGSIVSSWGDHSLPAGWLDPAMLLLWALLLVLYISLGVLTVVFGRPERPLLVSTLAGALLGLLLVLRVHHFGPGATLSTYVWNYGLYALAPLGSLTGATIAARLTALRTQRATAGGATRVPEPTSTAKLVWIVVGALAAGAFLGFLVSWPFTQAKLAVYQMADVEQLALYVGVQRFKGTAKTYEAALKDLLAALDAQERAGGVAIASERIVSIDRALTYSRLASLAEAQGDVESAAKYRASAEALCPKLGWQTCSASEIAEMAARADGSSIWAPTGRGSTATPPPGVR